MRKFNSNLAFVDLLFNLLVGFASLFIIAFLLIQPPKEQGKIDPPVEFLITVEWNDQHHSDVDTWVKGPDGKTVNFISRDRGYVVLNRDDTGKGNDTFVINGKETSVESNIEVLEVRKNVEGEYIVNLHLFNYVAADPRGGIEVTIKLLDMKPYAQVVEKKVVLPVHKSEVTAFTFTLDEDGEVLSVDTDAKVSIVTSRVDAFGGY